LIEIQLRDVANPRFARHETFAPRFGWLHKGFRAVTTDSEVFLREDAPVVLGVGKNMVSAIRYWSNAFKLTVERPKGGSSRANVSLPTWRAVWLLDENGADPYLEDPASLWLLHWWLLSVQEGTRCEAPTWWVAFHGLSTSRFTEEQLADHVLRHVGRCGWEPPVQASVARDVDCVTKMYAPRKAATGSPGSFEDLLDCPFRELGLLESVADSSQKTRIWRFTDVARTSLPPRVIAYTCLDYAATAAEGAGSVSLARLANEPGSPGRGFHLREADLSVALAEVCDAHPGLQMTEAAGHRSLVFREDPATIGWDVLDGHYHTGRTPWRTTKTAWGNAYEIRGAEPVYAEPTSKTWAVGASA
jgi:hypothetical protein